VTARTDPSAPQPRREQSATDAAAPSAAQEASALAALGPQGPRPGRFAATVERLRGQLRTATGRASAVPEAEPEADDRGAADTDSGDGGEAGDGPRNEANQDADETRLPGVQAVAQSLLQHALAPIGAVAVAIWAKAADGSFVPAGRAGDPERAVDRIALPAEFGGRVLGMLEVSWAQPGAYLSPAVRRQLEALAELCARTLEGEAAQDGARACADPDGSGHATGSTLADLVDGLIDPAMVLRPVHGGDGAVADFTIEHVNERFVDPAGRPQSSIVGLTLLEAYPVAARDGRLLDIVEHVYASGEPYASEQAVLDTAVGEIAVSAQTAIGLSRFEQAVVLSWRLRDETARLAEVLRNAQLLGRAEAFTETFAGDAAPGRASWSEQLRGLFGLEPAAQPVPLAELGAHAHPDDAARVGRFVRVLIRERKAGSVSFRLRRPDGAERSVRVVAEPVADRNGELASVRGAYQDLSSQHWSEVALAAAREQRLTRAGPGAGEPEREDDRLALRLQQAVMPDTALPGGFGAPGLEIAMRYQPAGQAGSVGGAWYDAVALPGGRVLLAVGDVTGHGTDAATAMIALRTALHGLAATGAGPARLLGWLNTVTYDLGGHVSASAVCGLYDTSSKALRWARAGRSPLLLTREGKVAALRAPASVLLGEHGATAYEESILRLQPGDALELRTRGAAGHGLGVRGPFEQADADGDTCRISVRVL